MDELTTWVKARNAMTPDDYETWEQRPVGRTLNAFENANDGRATILITHPIQDGRGLQKRQNGFGVGTQDDPSYTIDATGGQSVAISDVVARRLLPVEAERLQGLPDDHTRWKVDERTGATVEQSDSARYKQIGNGLAVPALSWIIEGILALEKEERERESDEGETHGPPGH